MKRETRPSYDAPRLLLAGFVFDLLLRRRRSFVEDARQVLRANPYPRTIEGAEHVPADGPFVLVMNHLSRRGLRPYHCAMVVSDALARRRPGEPHARWMFTSEYEDVRLGPVPIPQALIRWVFARIAAVYGFLVIPRRPPLRMARAAALRDAMRTLATRPIGLTPEGVDAPGILVEPPPGNGLFLLALARHGAPFLPVAAWEDEDGALAVRFGPTFSLSVPAGAGRTESDAIARTQVMLSIAALLPLSYRGVYAAGTTVGEGSSPAGD